MLKHCANFNLAMPIKCKRVSLLLQAHPFEATPIERKEQPKMNKSNYLFVRRYLKIAKECLVIITLMIIIALKLGMI
jgi:hypothetical protein